MSASMQGFLNSHKYLLLILIFAACLLTIYIDRPFIGHHEYNGVVYSTIARNFNRYGIINTSFAQIENQDKASPKEFYFMTHHPPILTVLLSISFGIFGEGEKAARLVPVIFSLATLILIYALTRQYFDKKTAILAAALACVTPMFIFYGKLPVQEVLGLPLILLSIFLYFRYIKRPSRNRYLLLLGSIVIGNFTSWPAYYLGAAFALHYLFFGKPKNKYLIAISFPFLCITTFAVYIFNLYIITGNTFGGNLNGALLQRLNVQQLGQPASLRDLTILQIRWLNAYYGKILIGISTITALSLAFKTKRFYKQEKYQLLIILLFMGVAHIVIFRGVAQYHDYFLIYLLPFIVITASTGIITFLNFLKLKPTALTLCAVLLVILIAISTLPFTKALINSNEFREGVEMGKYINANSQSGDQVLILSPEFKKYFEGFTEYYSDRKLIYASPNEKQLSQIVGSKKYKMIVAIPKRDTNAKAITFLNSKLKKTDFKYGIIVYHE